MPGIGLVAFMTASAKIAHKGANLIKRFLLLSLSDVTPVVATNIADIVTKITTIEGVDANQNRGRRLIELLITLNNSFLNTVQYEVTKTTNTHHSNNIFALLSVDCTERKEKESWGERYEARAGAHLPTPWFFELAKRPYDRADYCLDCSFLPQWKHRVLVFTLEWSEARSMVEQW